MTDDIPERLRRDANNRAPFMDEQMQVYAAVAEYVSPLNSPPASDPNWVPPWASKS